MINNILGDDISSIVDLYNPLDYYRYSYQMVQDILAHTNISTILERNGIWLTLPGMMVNAPQVMINAERDLINEFENSDGQFESVDEMLDDDLDNGGNELLLPFVQDIMENIFQMTPLLREELGDMMSSIAEDIGEIVQPYLITIAVTIDESNQ